MKYEALFEKYVSMCSEKVKFEKSKFDESSLTNKNAQNILFEKLNIQNPYLQRLKIKNDLKSAYIKL